MLLDRSIDYLVRRSNAIATGARKPGGNTPAVARLLLLLHAAAVVRAASARAPIPVAVAVMRRRLRQRHRGQHGDGRRRAATGPRRVLRLRRRRRTDHDLLSALWMRRRHRGTLYEGDPLYEGDDGGVVGLGERVLLAGEARQPPRGSSGPAPAAPWPR